jgi:hypothetical protein
VCERDGEIAQEYEKMGKTKEKMKMKKKKKRVADPVCGCCSGGGCVCGCGRVEGGNMAREQSRAVRSSLSKALRNGG